MNDRDARRKILLLKGTLYRLEILQARHTLREAASRNVLADRLPGLLKSLLANNRAALLTTVLPMLVGGGRLRRIARRALLAAGGVVAAWVALRRGRGDAGGDATGHK